MGVNLDKPQLWKSDIAKSVDMYNARNTEIYYKVAFQMVEMWSFWKMFFTAYLVIVAGIWGFLEGYNYFQGEIFKLLLGSYRIIIYGLPLVSAIALCFLVFSIHKLSWPYCFSTILCTITCLRLDTYFAINCKYGHTHCLYQF